MEPKAEAQAQGAGWGAGERKEVSDSVLFSVTANKEVSTKAC